MTEKDLWAEKFNIQKPESCNRKALCCKVATSVNPWEKLARAKYSPLLKDFFNIFIPYNSQEDVKKLYPEAYEACKNVAISRNIKLEDVYFYRCRFIIEPNACPIYEDRPQLCRDYPDSPFDAIPSICGFHDWSQKCLKKNISLHQELYTLKFNQFKDHGFFIHSPGSSWLSKL